MKNLMLIMIALVGLTASAQERDTKKNQRQMLHLEEFSPEEIAQIKTKKLTLSLDLSESQQQKIQVLQLEKAKNRKDKSENRKKKTVEEIRKKPSKEDRLAMINERLDRQLAEKASMKDILNDAQFAKWEAQELNKHAKRSHGKKRLKKHKRK